MKKKRPQICPNYGFAERLLEYDKKLFGKRSMEMEDYVFMDMIQTHEIEGDTKWVQDEIVKCNKNWDEMMQKICNRLYTDKIGPIV